MSGGQVLSQIHSRQSDQIVRIKLIMSDNFATEQATRIRKQRRKMNSIIINQHFIKL